MSHPVKFGWKLVKTPPPGAILAACESRREAEAFFRDLNLADKRRATIHELETIEYAIDAKTKTDIQDSITFNSRWLVVRS